MDTIQEEVLAFFREEILGSLDKNWKENPLELDSDLFDSPGDDLHDALDKFEKKFNVDLKKVKWSHYFPWENTPLLTRWGCMIKEKFSIPHPARWGFSSDSS